MQSQVETPRLAGFGESAGFVVLRPLTESEWTDAVTALRVLAGFDTRERVYQVLSANFEGFFGLVFEIAAAYAKREVRSELQVDVIRAEIDRHLLNFLMSMRLYLDHTDHALVHRFGNASSQHAAFKSACSGAYDGCFAYRFLYRLRNFAQHQGLPVGSFILSDSVTGEDEEGHSVMLKQGEKRVYLSLRASPKTLAREYDGWSKVRNELEAMTDDIDLVGQVRQCMDRLAGIHALVMEMERELCHPFAVNLWRFETEVRAEAPELRAMIIENSRMTSSPSPDPRLSDEVLSMSVRQFPLPTLHRILGIPVASEDGGEAQDA